MKRIVTILFLAIHIFCTAQNPNIIKWEKSYEEWMITNLTSILKTTNNSYLLGGIGSGDFTVVKTDSVGNSKWTKHYGGKEQDLLISIQPANDGYFLAGYTYSYGGDIQSGNHGGSDIWLIKTDLNGNIVWEKTYGGKNGEILQSARLIKNGNLLLYGSTNSNDGDIKSGNNGTSDAWVFEIDPTGKIVWEKTFGGNDLDIFFTSQQTLDGGYIFGGLSFSNDFDVQSGNKGASDFWIVKTDSIGNIKWEKTFGGTNWERVFSIDQMSSGEYIAAGPVGSNDGDIKSINHGDRDFWVIKLDLMGNLIWEQTYGGMRSESLNSMLLDENDKILLFGTTNSNDGDVQSNQTEGKFDWLVEISKDGKLLYEQTFTSNNYSENILYDEKCFIDRSHTGNYLLGSGSNLRLVGPNTPPKSIYLSNTIVSENLPIGIATGVFSTIDEDEKDTFKYALISGDGDTDNNSFFISNDTLYAKEKFDFETKNAYSIRVQSEDNKGNKLGKIFTINIENNTAPTDITLYDTIIVFENIRHSRIGNFSAIDKDVNDTFHFDLISGLGDMDNGYFWIEGNSLMTDTIFDFEKQSTYTIRVEATDSEGNSFSKPIEIFIKNINDITVQNVVTKYISCSGNSDGSITYELTDFVSPVSFNWSNGDTTQNLNNVGSGDYTLKIVDGDSMTYKAIFHIGTKPIFPATQICYVTSNMFANSIQIDKGPGNYNIARYCIYREGIYANIYEKIGEISAAENSFVDSLINNRSQSYTYKVSAIDSCGVESALSPAHSTIHLTQNRGISGEVNLYWANYSGIDVSTYSIFRQKENETFELVKQISSNKNTFSDFDINPSFNYQYYVSFEKEDVCYTTLNQKSGEKILVKSNIVSTNKDYTRSEIIQSPVIKIYPNPVSGKLYVETGTDKPTGLILLDVTGKQIIHQCLNENKNEIKLPKIVDGIYFIKLMVDNQIIHYQKIIKVTE